MVLLSESPRKSLIQFRIVFMLLRELSNVIGAVSKLLFQNHFGAGKLQKRSASNEERVTFPVKFYHFKRKWRATNLQSRTTVDTLLLVTVVLLKPV